MAPSEHNGPPRLRIGYVYDCSYPFSKGGAELRYYTQASQLAKRGHSFDWFTTKQWPGESLIERGGIRYHAISNAQPSYVRGRRSILQAIRFGIDCIGLLNYHGDLDLIEVAQYPFFHIMPLYLFARRRRIKLIVTWYEYWGDHWYEYLGIAGVVGKWIERTLARLLPNIVAISESTQRRLIAHGARSDGIVLIPNFIDHQKIESIAPRGERYDICYFGRLKAHKNVDALLKAIHLCGLRGLKLKTKIIGDGPERNRLERLATRLGLDDNLTFLGRIEGYDELIGYVKSAQLFVNPSTKEGGGSIVSLEANAAGVPTLAVCHPMGLDRSLIRENFNGYWAESISPSELADRITYHLSTSSATRKEMSRNAIALAAQYDIGPMVNKIEEYYLSLVRDTD